MNKDFSLFFRNKKIIYLDNAGSLLKPDSVINSFKYFYKNIPFNTNNKNNHFLYKNKRHIESKTRILISELIKCTEKNIEFVPSSSHALNFIANFFNRGSKKEEVILFISNHASNIYPWIINKWKIKYFKKNNIEEINKHINKNTKILSFSHISNSLGEINNVEKIIKSIRKKKEDIFVIVDISQSIAHQKIDVSLWDADCIIFSAHKIYGPEGLGIIWIKDIKYHLFKGRLVGGNKKIEDEKKKFEVGTPPTSQIFALNKALEFIKKNGIENIIKKEEILYKYGLEEIKKIKNLKIHNSNANSIITFNLKGLHSHDVSNLLAKENIIVRSGNFCTPFLENKIKINSALRVSLAFYNTKEEINILVKELKKINSSTIIDSLF